MTFNGGGSLSLDGGSWTGDLNLLGGVFVVNDKILTGSISGSGILMPANGGIINGAIASSVPIHTIDNAVINSSNFLGHILSEGEAGAGVSFTGNNVIQALDVGSGISTFTASNTFVAPVHFLPVTSGSLVLGGGQSLPGGMFLEGGIVTLSGTNADNGRWIARSNTLGGGVIRVKANNAVQSITLYGGGVVVDPGVTLTVLNPTLTLYSGSLTGGFAGLSSIVKDGMTGASLNSFTGFTGQVLLQAGTLTVTTSPCQADIASPGQPMPSCKRI